MPPIITLPGWILLTCAALWIFTIVLFFAFHIARKKALRSKGLDTQSPTMHWPDRSGFGLQVHHELLNQQIDAVFNALGTIIQTERVKLKTLINHSMPQVDDNPIPSEPIVPSTPSNASQGGYEDIGNAVVRLSDQGLNHDEIARELGLSYNEVRLAAKMNAGMPVQRPMRLHAVV